MRKLVLTFLALGMGASVASAAEAPGNCEKTAQSITTKASGAYSAVLVREWDPNAFVFDEKTQQIIQTGDWLDPVPDTQPGAKRGVYYYKLAVSKGKNYLLWTDAGANCIISMRRTSGMSIRGFSSVTARDTGIIYWYFRAEDWTDADDSKCEYVVELMSPTDRGASKNLYVREQAVKDVVKNPGSRIDPILLDFASPGSATVAEPTDMHPTLDGLLATYYEARLVANTTYHLELTTTAKLPADYKNFIDIFSGDLEFPDPKPVWDSSKRTYAMNIRARQDVTVKFYVVTYKALETTLWWNEGTSRNGAFGGLLTGESGSRKVSSWFRVTMNGLGISGSVTVDGVTQTFAGQDGIVNGQLTAGGKTYDWQLSVKMVDSKAVSLSGSVYAKIGGEVVEFHYSGSLSRLGEKEYTILFYPNGGAGTLTHQQCAWGKVYNLRSCAFVPPANKRFAGWRLMPEGGSAGKRYDSGVLIFNLTANPDVILKLQAIWE